MAKCKTLTGSAVKGLKSSACHCSCRPSAVARVLSRTIQQRSGYDNRFVCSLAVPHYITLRHKSHVISQAVMRVNINASVTAGGGQAPVLSPCSSHIIKRRQRRVVSSMRSTRPAVMSRTVMCVRRHKSLKYVLQFHGQLIVCHPAHLTQVVVAPRNASSFMPSAHYQLIADITRQTAMLC